MTHGHRNPCRTSSGRWVSRAPGWNRWYLTGVCLPLLVFAAAADLILVPLTTILVAGISDEHAGIASSMFNAGQQVGGAVGLAAIRARLTAPLPRGSRSLPERTVAPL